MKKKSKQDLETYAVRRLFDSPLKVNKTPPEPEPLPDGPRLKSTDILEGHIDLKEDILWHS